MTSGSSKIFKKGLREVLGCVFITRWEDVKKAIKTTEDYIYFQKLFKPFTKILKHFDDAPFINEIKFKNCDIENGVINFGTGVDFYLKSDDFTISYYEEYDCKYDKDYNIIEDNSKFYLTYRLNGGEKITKEFSQKVLNEIIAEIHKMQQ
jgi:hypothetical protein